MGQAWFPTRARGHQYTALFLGLQSAKLNIYFPLELSRVFWVENHNEPNPYIPFRSNWFEVLLCFFPSKWTWHELEGRTKILVPPGDRCESPKGLTFRVVIFLEIVLLSVQNCLCYLRFLLMSPCWMTLWPIFPFLPPLIPISTTKSPPTTHRDPPKKHTHQPRPVQNAMNQIFSSSGRPETRFTQALPVYLVHFEFDPEMPELLNLPLCDSCGLQAALVPWTGRGQGQGHRHSDIMWYICIYVCI